MTLDDLVTSTLAAGLDPATVEVRLVTTADIPAETTHALQPLFILTATDTDRSVLAIGPTTRIG